MIEYSNNGLAWVNVDPGSETTPGCWRSWGIASAEDLTAAFPGYPEAAAVLAKALANAAVQAKMDALDGGGQARAVRGAVLAAGLPASNELARLQALDAQIAALRATLAS